MRNPGGQATVTPFIGRAREVDTFSCGHCNRIVFVPFKCDPADLGGMCYGCTKLVCPGCVGKGCDPLEEKLARDEARYHALRSYGSLA